MKNILFAVILFMGIHSMQAKDKTEIDIKDDSVLVNGKVAFLFEKIKYLPGTFNYFVKDLSGKKLAFLKFYDYNDYKEISSANPKGRVTYYEVTFLESGQKAEIPAFARQLKMAELLVKQNLVQDGTISKESEQEFILVNGTPYSKKRSEMDGGNTIIINNNSATPVQRNGINININKDDE
jgi:hypothetical protein